MLIYVTKWVLARGILLVEGTVPQRRGQSYYLYSDVRGVGRRASVVLIGREAFLTLKEARADARERFKVRLKRAQVEHRQALACWDHLEKGADVAVHKAPVTVSKCGPFSQKRPTGRSGRVL